MESLATRGGAEPRATRVCVCASCVACVCVCLRACVEISGSPISQWHRSFTRVQIPLHITAAFPPPDEVNSEYRKEEEQREIKKERIKREREKHPFRSLMRIITLGHLSGGI